MRRQLLNPHGLLPGLFIAALLYAVALAAFLALWSSALDAGWQSVFSDSYLWHMVHFSFWQVLLSALFSVEPTIFLTRALYWRRFPGRALLLCLCTMTLILPMLVAAFDILSVYGHRDWLASLFHTLGWQWGFSPYGLQGILLAHVFFNMSMATHLLLQVLKSIPGGQRQIAVQLGMRGYTLFRLIEWPWVCRHIPAVAMLVFMLYFASSTTMLSLGGGPKATTIGLAIYQALSFDYDPARAVVLTLIQMLCCLTLILLGQCLSRAVTIGVSHVHGWHDPDDRLCSRLSDGLLTSAALLLLPPPLLAVIVDGINRNMLNVLVQPAL